MMTTTPPPDDYDYEYPDDPDAETERFFGFGTNIVPVYHRSGKSSVLKPERRTEFKNLNKFHLLRRKGDVDDYFNSNARGARKRMKNFRRSASEYEFEY